MPVARNFPASDLPVSALVSVWLVFAFVHDLAARLYLCITFDCPAQSATGRNSAITGRLLLRQPGSWWHKSQRVRYFWHTASACDWGQHPLRPFTFSRIPREHPLG